MRLHPLVISVAILVGGTSFTLAHVAGPSAAPATQASTEPIPETATAERSPNDELDDINLEGVTFQQAITRLQTLSGVPIEVDWNGLRQVGVKYNTPISIHAQHRTLLEVLTAICLLTVPHDQLYVSADDAGAHVSLGRDAPWFVEVHVYDVRDLLKQDSTDELVKLIQDVIEPKSWHDVNSNAPGACRGFNGKLVVVNTLKNQAAVANLLKQLRNADNAPAGKK